MSCNRYSSCSGLKRLILANAQWRLLASSTASPTDKLCQENKLKKSCAKKINSKNTHFKNTLGTSKSVQCLRRPTTCAKKKGAKFEITFYFGLFVGMKHNGGPKIPIFIPPAPELGFPSCLISSTTLTWRCHPPILFLYHLFPYR